jgi:hypothetical protein
MEKVWVIYVPSQHRLFRESLLASCVSRRDWRAEGRRARVASIGAAEALCWAVDLGCTPLSQAPATSYGARRRMQVCMWMRRERGRYGRVWACSVGFVTYRCLSVCVPSIPHFTSITAVGKSQSTYIPTGINTRAEQCWCWRFEEGKKKNNKLQI